MEWGGGAVQTLRPLGEETVSSFTKVCVLCFEDVNSSVALRQPIAELTEMRARSVLKE